VPLRRIDKLILPGDPGIDFPVLRHDTAVVAKLTRAIDNAGGTWPDDFNIQQILIDQDDLVLGGRHRITAARKRGVEGRVNCTVRTFTGIEDRLLAAIADNAVHGKGWTPKEEAELLILCESFGMQRVDVAKAFRVPLTAMERKPIASVIGRTGPARRVYVPRPARQAFKHRDEITEQEAQVMESFVTPHPVGVHMAEILRIAELNALPSMTPDLYTLARETSAALDAWVDRDQHLLDGEEAA